MTDTLYPFVTIELPLGEPRPFTAADLGPYPAGGTGNARAQWRVRALFYLRRNVEAALHREFDRKRPMMTTPDIARVHEIARTEIMALELDSRLPSEHITVTIDGGGRTIEHSVPFRV